MPAANVTNEDTTASLVATYPGAGTNTPSQAYKVFQLAQEYRGNMRIEPNLGRFGVGYLTQDPALDTFIAQQVVAQPNLTSAVRTDREAAQSAIATAAQALTPNAYPVSYSAGIVTTNPYSISSGDYCAKGLFANIPAVELLTSGMRYVGISVAETVGGTCGVIVGLRSVGTWQVAPFGTTSVYPYPGKLLTLTTYQGDFASITTPAIASVPGHPVFVSVATSDSLPADIPGIGTGTAISPSAITVTEFTLVEKVAGAAVPARILTPAGVVAGPGVTTTTTNLFRFPTSMALLPNAPLKSDTIYTATFRAVVRGRTVFRTWDFTTGQS